MANAVIFLIKVRRVEPPGHRKDIRATERLHHAHITSAAPACLQQVHPLPLPLLFILMTIQCHPSQASLLTPSPPARPAPGYSMHRTPLQGLYLCGAGGSTHNPTHCFFSLLWRVCIALQLLLLLCNAHLCMCTPWWRSAGGRRPQLRFGRAERQGQEHAGLIASHAPLCATAVLRQNYRLPQPLPSFKIKYKTSPLRICLFISYFATHRTRISVVVPSPLRRTITPHAEKNGEPQSLTTGSCAPTP